MVCICLYLKMQLNMPTHFLEYSILLLEQTPLAMLLCVPEKLFSSHPLYPVTHLLQRLELKLYPLLSPNYMKFVLMYFLRTTFFPFRELTSISTTVRPP